MTNFLNNNGTVAIMTPIAVSTALAGGMNPRAVVLVINALKCPFCEKNEEFGRRMAHMGNNVTLRTFTESVHGFTVRLQGEWQEAQKLIIEFLKR